MPIKLSPMFNLVLNQLQVRSLFERQEAEKHLKAHNECERRIREIQESREP